MAVLTPVKPHPKVRHSGGIFPGVPVHEAANADFKAGDLVAITNGLLDKFTGNAASTAPLAFANADARRYQDYIRDSWSQGAGTMKDRGTIVYRVTKEDRIVMTVAGVTADVKAIVGQKRDIAYDSSLGFATVVATATNAKVQIESVLEGADGDTNVTVICVPLQDGDKWY